MTLALGSLLASYEILGRLGSGGMGVVYEARDTRLDRRVALKLLPPELGLEPERLARFDREARILAGLNHPNIVTVYALEQSDGRPFLVMERVSGRTLADLMGSGALPAARVLDLAVPIALALGAAHERGIVHRDLKPANVMVDDEGRVKVLDFGLARADPAATEAQTTLALTREGTVMGTLPYMSPEQVRGERTDARTDIFALGTMLYEMAAGIRPFRGASAADLAAAIIGSDPPPLDTVCPGAPPRLGRLIHRCLRKDPRRRLQSALDVAQELQDLADEHRTAAAAAVPRREVGDLPERARMRIPRSAAAGAGLLAILAVLAGSFLLPRVRGPASGPAGAVGIRSLAVLPFDNLTRDPSQDYFVDGLHEEVITELARLGAVGVRSRNSVMRYRARQESVTDIARDLQVDAVIEGSVLRAGDRVRISAQLILGQSDEHVWAESYDRDLQDVLTLLSEVSNAIAREVHSRLNAGAGSPAPRRDEHRVRPEAYDAYLRGRRALMQLTSARGLPAAREEFQRAIDLDPTFARAWSSHAIAGVSMAFFGQVPAAEVLPGARAAALRALSLDDHDARAHAVLGFVELYFDWSFDSARARLERAVALDPNEFSVRHALADYYMVMGRLDDSLEQVRAGQLAEPDSSMAYYVVAAHTMATGRLEEAAVVARRALELFPHFQMLHGLVGDLFWHEGKHAEALAEYRLQFGDSHEIPGLLEREFRAGGPRRAAKAHADWLAARPWSGGGHYVSVAGMYARAGETEAAFAWLEKAFEDRAPQLLHVTAFPEFDTVRNDGRYAALMRRIGIPEGGSR
jgi:eukaryotic-like serine/threonine-protein kinase